MLRRALLELIAALALSTNYAAAYVVAFIWNIPTRSSELVFHIAILFAASFLFAILIADFRKTIVYTLASVVVGIGMAVGVILAPPILTGAGPELVDFYLTIGLLEFSRLFIIGVSFLVLGTLFGALLAETRK